jgi:hypothetical protein
VSGGNADAVSAADHVAPPAGDDGVAQVLEHILGRSGARHALSLRARQSRIIGSWRSELSRTRPISKMPQASLREPLWPTSGAGWKP